MNETFKISRVGKHEKFGEWILIDDGSEKGKFLGINAQVAGFLSKKVPCSVQVEEKQDLNDRKGVITRVKVLNSEEQKSENQFEQPIETVRPGEKKEFTTAKGYKSTPDYYEQMKDRQNSIENQFCWREAVTWIKTHNEMCNEEEKIKPTYQKIVEFMNLVKQGIKGEFPDY